MIIIVRKLIDNLSKGNYFVDVERLKKIRKDAEAAVSDMPAGDLKTKAFEVILQQLMVGGAKLSSEAISRIVKRPKRRMGGQTLANGPKAQIMRLHEEKFFSQPRSLQDAQKKLRERGFRYPVTTTSVVLMRMTQQRILRRTREGKKGYVYTNW